MGSRFRNFFLTFAISYLILNEPGLAWSSVGNKSFPLLCWCELRLLWLTDRILLALFERNLWRITAFINLPHRCPVLMFAIRFNQFGYWHVMLIGWRYVLREILHQALVHVSIQHWWVTEQRNATLHNLFFELAEGLLSDVFAKSRPLLWVILKPIQVDSMRRLFASFGLVSGRGASVRDFQQVTGLDRNHN